MTYIRRFQTNLGHDWFEVKANLANDDDDQNRSVEFEFTGRDPVSVSARYTDVRDVRAIGQALIDAANYLAPEPARPTITDDELFTLTCLAEHLRSVVDPDDEVGKQRRAENSFRYASKLAEIVKRCSP